MFYEIFSRSITQNENISKIIVWINTDQTLYDDKMLTSYMGWILQQSK